MVTSEEQKLRKKNKKLKRQLRKYKQKYKLARGASRQASNKGPHEEFMETFWKHAQDSQDRKAEQRITDAADRKRERCMARDRKADSHDGIDAKPVSFLFLRGRGPRWPSAPFAPSPHV